MAKRLRLREFLPYRLSVLANRFSRDIAKSYQERFRLSIPEWRVIATLGERDGLSAGEVAAYTAMDKVAVSRAVGKLLKTGRIARTPDSADKRRAHLTLTEKGRAIYDQVAPFAQKYERRVYAKLSAEERAQLDHLLEKLSRIQKRIEE